MAKAQPIFSPETFRFFKELKRNNRKEWMDENRGRYQNHVVAPFRALLDALTPAIRKLNPTLDTMGRTGRNFSRINRDIRFAKDKSPYRPQMYLMFSDGSEAGQLYTALSDQTATTGFRIYGNTRNSVLATIARPRAAANSRWLAAQAKRLGRKYESYWYTTEKGAWTKHKGWPLKPENWKRMQGWVVRKKMRPAAVTKPGFVKEVQKTFQELWPVWQMTSARSWKK